MPSPTISWHNNGVRLIDQTKLPGRLVYLHCRDVKSLWHAIKRLSVRGAPAIGLAGALGVRLAAEQYRRDDVVGFVRHVLKAARYLATSRPTAVNLFHCIDKMTAVFEEGPLKSVRQLKALVRKRSVELYEHDRKTCRQLGAHGAVLIKNHASILTICNAGALATADYGTALGVMYTAKEKGKRFKVYACETRPLLQGARLTAWELKRARIDTTLVCDSMAAALMAQGKIDLVITGADRIAANGDTANKIGTYSLAVLAKHHKIPFFVAAPLSTFDIMTKTGKAIPIEERASGEVTGFGGRVTAPKGIEVYNPAFDVTPGRLIAGFITEAGVIRRPYKRSIGLKLKRET